MYKLYEVSLMGLLFFLSWDCKCASFRKLVTLLEQEVTSCDAERLSGKIHTSEMIDGEDSELDISTIIADLFGQKGVHLSPEVLKLYLSAGKRLYKKSSKIYKEICCFEASIKGPFFMSNHLMKISLKTGTSILTLLRRMGILTG